MTDRDKVTLHQEMASFIPGWSKSSCEWIWKAVLKNHRNYSLWLLHLKILKDKIWANWQQSVCPYKLTENVCVWITTQQTGLFSQSSLQPMLSGSKVEEVLKSIHSEAVTVMLWQPSPTCFSWPNKPHLSELLCQNLKLYFAFCFTRRKPDQNYIVIFGIIVLSSSTSKNNENTYMGTHATSTHAIVQNF